MFRSDAQDRRERVACLADAGEACRSVSEENAAAAAINTAAVKNWVRTAPTAVSTRAALRLAPSVSRVIVINGPFGEHVIMPAKQKSQSFSNDL